MEKFQTRNEEYNIEIHEGVVGISETWGEDHTEFTAESLEGGAIISLVEELRGIRFTKYRELDKVGVIHAATQADADFVFTSLMSALALMPSFSYSTYDNSVKKQLTILQNRICEPDFGKKEILDAIKGIIESL
jgi:hypothetical protein